MPAALLCQPPVPTNSPQTPKDQLIPSCFLPLQLVFPLLSLSLHPPWSDQVKLLAKILLQSSGCKFCWRNPTKTGMLHPFRGGKSAGQILICPLCIVIRKLKAGGSFPPAEKLSDHPGSNLEDKDIYLIRALLPVCVFLDPLINAGRIKCSSPSADFQSIQQHFA